MSTVIQNSRKGNTSRPRELLQKRTQDRLLTAARHLGHEVEDEATKEELIEMITTDGPASEG